MPRSRNVHVVISVHITRIEEMYEISKLSKYMFLYAILIVGLLLVIKATLASGWRESEWVLPLGLTTALGWILFGIGMINWIMEEDSHNED
jgi:glucan phosphoethanolaminetransferase (alkaline phosphatase superfamily)